MLMEHRSEVWVNNKFTYFFRFILKLCKSFEKIVKIYVKDMIYCRRIHKILMLIFKVVPKQLNS